VSTVFRTEQGLKVFLPVAEATERLPRRNIVHLWIAADGQISVDDYTVNPSQVRGIVALKLTENPNLIVSLVADRRTRYRVVSEVMDQLREALALRVSFTTKFER
jgi:biopolymer transport protein ExbD